MAAEADTGRHHTRMVEAEAEAAAAVVAEVADTGRPNTRTVAAGEVVAVAGKHIASIPAGTDCALAEVHSTGR